MDSGWKYLKVPKIHQFDKILNVHFFKKNTVLIIIKIYEY
jgi:hypothetical protein